MIEVEDMPSLLETAVQCKDGVYRPARPLPTFFDLRLRDALEVLRGRAVAVYLYDGSETGPRIRRTGFRIEHKLPHLPLVYIPRLGDGECLFVTREEAEQALAGYKERFVRHDAAEFDAHTKIVEHDSV